MYTFEFLLANRFPGVGMLSLWFLRIPKCKRASLFTNEILMELGRYHRLTIRRVDGMIGTVDRRKAFETLSGLVAIRRTISTNVHGLRKDSTRATVNFDIYNEMVTGCGHLFSTKSKNHLQQQSTFMFYDINPNTNPFDAR
jgi:hypothetical protein